MFHIETPHGEIDIREDGGTFSMAGKSSKIESIYYALVSDISELSAFDLNDKRAPLEYARQVVPVSDKTFDAISQSGQTFLGRLLSLGRDDATLFVREFDRAPKSRQTPDETKLRKFQSDYELELRRHSRAESITSQNSTRVAEKSNEAVRSKDAAAMNPHSASVARPEGKTASGAITSPIKNSVSKDQGTDEPPTRRRRKSDWEI